MKRLRSLLFVPGDRPERIEKALASDADALILDLEDAVAPAAKPAARANVARILSGGTRLKPLLVRINPLDAGMLDADLDAAGGMADAIVLPKAGGAPDIERLAARIGLLKILPIATETPSAIFTLGSYATVADRLIGLTWGAEDLPAAIGAATAREADGRYTPPYELARSLTLFAAHAARVPAIDTVFPAYRDPDGLAGHAARAMRDGFTGMLAIHPAQLETINAAFTPSAAMIARARTIVALFAANPGAGAIGFEGKMLDFPHLVQARAILEADRDLIGACLPDGDRPSLTERPIG